MSVMIEIFNGVGDGNDVDASTTSFAGSPSGTTGTVLAGDTSPTTLFESELEGIAGGTSISLASTGSIVIDDLTDNTLSLQQTAAQSVTFDTGAGGFSMNAGDTLATAGGALVITATGSASVGSLSAGSVAITASQIALNGAAVTTVTDQAYNNAALLGAAALLTSTAGGNIRFMTTLNGAFDLVANTTGGSDFFGVVGGLTPLGSLTTDAGGLTRVALDVTTSGSQTYGDQLALFGNLALTSTAGGTLSFANVDNNFTLALNTSGATVFANPVGSLATLDALTTNAGGTTAINGGSVTTNNAQSYNDAVTLGANTVLTSNLGGNLSFAGTLDGARTLALNTTGATTLGGAVGAGTALTTLTTNAGGTTAINGGSVRTTGDQIYNDAVTLGAAALLTSTAGGNIRFMTTLNGAFDLVANTTGGSDFFGVVGGLTPLGSLTTDAGGLTRVALDVTTSGSQTYGDQLALFGNLALTSTAGGTLSFANIDNNFTLVLNTSGATVFANPVGSLAVLDALTTNAGGTTAINGGSVTTNNAQSYNDAVTLGANTVLTSNLGGNLSFAGTLDGARTLALNTTGATTLGGAVGAGTALTTLTTNAGGTTAINGGSVRTTGDQIYNDAVTLGAAALLTSTAGGNIRFMTTLNGAFDLVANTTGGSDFFGVVGGLTPLGSLTTDAGGLTRVALDVTTSGSQTYGDQLALFGNVALTSTAGGTLSFANIDNNFTLALNTSGATVFANPVGSLVALDALTTNAGGTTAINGGSVTTEHAQTYNDAVTLGAAAVLTSTAADNLSFAGTIDGAGALALDTAGTTTLGGAVGAATALAALSTDAAGATAINGGSIRTSGAQTYNDAVTLGASTVLTSTGAGAITFNDTVNAGAFDLAVSTAGSAAFNGSIFGTGKFTQSGTGVTTLAAPNFYIGDTNIDAGTLLVNGTIVSASFVHSGGTLGGSGNTLAVSVASGGTLSPGASAGTLHTGNLSFASGGIFKVELGGTGAGQFDQVSVTGAVNLAGATLAASLIGGFDPEVLPVASFTIIDNDGVDAVTGTFAGLAEGAAVTIGAGTFVVSYAGGSGNDVVLSAVNDPPVNTVPPTHEILIDGNAVIVGLSIADVDAGAGVLTTQLSVAHGTLAVAPAGGAGVAGSGTGHVTLTGTLAQINTTLGAPHNVIYSPADGFAGADALTVSTDDGGNTGPGGPKTDTDQVTFDVTTGPVIFGFSLTEATVTYAGSNIFIDGPSSHTVVAGVKRFSFTDGTVNNDDGDPLVDDLFYYSHNHDVWNAHADADAHYHASGRFENRDPNAFFSTSIYLSANQDVNAAGVDPLVHFDQSGWKEGRIPSLNFDPAAYLAANPDVAAAHVDPLAHFLQFGAGEGRQPFTPGSLVALNGFDVLYYLQHNPDVAAAHVDPFQHFQTFGWQEGRNPNAFFDVNGYLAAYPDVAAAHVNPLDHYHQFGFTEGRDPSVGFDTTDYLSHYPDVAAAHVDPLVHFLLFGIHEGRSPFGDGVFG